MLFIMKIGVLKKMDGLEEYKSEENKKRNIILCIISSFGILINSLLVIVSFIPCFVQLRYRPGGRYYWSDSIITATVSNHDPIGIITLVLCVVDLSLFILYLVQLKRKKELSFSIKIISITLLVTNIVLMFFAYMNAAGYTARF